MAVLPTGIGSAVAGGYEIGRSLRFNSADTPTLTRTPTVSGSRRIYTHSAWFKRTGLSSAGFNVLWASEASGTNYVSFVYYQDKFYWNFYNGTTSYVVETTQVFRDVSAWGHIVVAVDTTQATAANRVRIYYNGVQITVFNTSTYPPQDQDLPINTSSFVHKIGFSAGFGQYLNGYMTEVNFLDGYPTVGGTPYNATTWAALNVSTLFSETDTNTGVWKPKVYAGSYGTNGFYVNFSDNSNTTAATLGKDYSGNGNNLTPSGFSVTADVGNDSLVDSPTSYGTDTGVGGTVRGNYCTMNPLTVPTLPTLANGNLDVSVSATGVKIAQGTFQFPSSGKWYYECTFNNASSGVNGMFIGITSPTRGPNVTRSTAGAYFFYASTSGLLNSNGTDIVTGLSAISANEVFKVAVDVDNSKVWVGRGSIWYNSSGGTTGDPAAGTNPTFSISANGLTPMSGFDASSVSLSMNFGQRAFAYTAPSGFKALCTQNLPTPTIGATSTTQAGKYFNVRLYSGNGNTGQTITGVGFQPDFTWLKNRNIGGGYFHLLYDAVRGAGYNLRSDSTAAETNRTAVFSAFTSDGFTFPAGQGNTIDNDSAGTYASWNWKANGAGSTNSNGTAKSSSVTVDSSTDTVTWNSHGMSDGQKIGFFASVMPGGLSAGTLYFVRDAATNTFKVAATSGGAAIDITTNGTTVTAHTTLTSTVSASSSSGFSVVTYTGTGANTTVEHGIGTAPTFIIVKRRNSAVGWPCLVKAANNGNGQNGRLNLNETAAYADNVEFWNNTSPTSNVFSVGIHATTNASGGTYVAYCFAPVAGYSAFGSYESNNSTDGPFIYLGFRPRWIMFKRSSTGTNGWAIYDTARNTFNVTNNNLHANTTDVENAVAGVQPIDVTANGIKIRTSWSDVNGTGTYIYAAFAENPFKYSLAR